MTELPLVEMFTDGACRGNPGPGGWAVLIRAGAREKELSGGEPLTTNNRMELMAAISGLEALNKPCRVQLHTDSTYVRDGITRWIHNWQRNGWRTSDKKPVKNAELWQALFVRLGTGERVDPVVFGMAAVPLDPVPLDSVPRGRVEQLLP